MPSGFVLTSVPVVGDETLGFKVSQSTSGVSVSGYAISFRYKNTIASVAAVGLSGSVNLDDAVALANAQVRRIAQLSRSANPPSPTRRRQ